jgi:hypothetical protein
MLQVTFYDGDVDDGDDVLLFNLNWDTRNGYTVEPNLDQTEWSLEGIVKFAAEVLKEPVVVGDQTYTSDQPSEFMESLRTRYSGPRCTWATSVRETLRSPTPPAR